MRRKALFILAAIVLLLIQTRPVSAAAIFDVSFALPDAGAPWSLLFQLTDGSGLFPGGDGNNTVALSNFNFGTATVVGDPALDGGAAGSLGSGVVLTDTSFLSSFTPILSGGGLFSFRMTLTNLLDVSGTPDIFALTVFNGSGEFLPGSEAASGALLIATLNGGESPAIETFGGLKVQPVPEPGTLVLLITGMSGVAARRLFRRGAASAG